jgi:glycosyltransferase involved in cell wall biosynthesis
VQAQEELAKKYCINFPFLVYVSSFRPYKNHLLLLQAYDILMREHNIPHHLVFIGNDIGNYRAVVEKAANGLSSSSKGKVHFLDYVHHWDLAGLYRSASLALYPSELETFGIPPLEAMACGTPVIVSGFTAIPEVSGGGACIVDPHDICAQADAMFRVLDDRVYREDLVKLGLTWCQQYTWHRSISETLALMAEYSS